MLLGEWLFAFCFGLGFGNCSSLNNHATRSWVASWALALLFYVICMLQNDASFVKSFSLTLDFNIFACWNFDFSYIGLIQLWPANSKGAMAGYLGAICLFYWDYFFCCINGKAIQ